MGRAFVAKLAKKGAHNPEALAAWIGRRKYGRGPFEQLAEHAARKAKAGRLTDAKTLRNHSDEDLAALHQSPHVDDAGRGRIEDELQRRDHADQQHKLRPDGRHLATDLSGVDDDTLIQAMGSATPEDCVRLAAEYDRRYPPAPLPHAAHTGDPLADLLADRQAVDHALSPLGNPDGWGALALDGPADGGQQNDEPTGRVSRAQAREMYREYVYTQWLAAEDACRGVLLNRRGEAAGINPESLFSGPAHVAFAYASDELKDWWARHERLSQAAFTEQLTGVSSGATSTGRTAAAALQNRR